MARALPALDSNGEVRACASACCGLSLLAIICTHSLLLFLVVVAKAISCIFLAFLSLSNDLFSIHIYIYSQHSLFLTRFRPSLFFFFSSSFLLACLFRWTGQKKATPRLSVTWVGRTTKASCLTSPNSHQLLLLFRLNNRYLILSFSLPPPPKKKGSSEQVLLLLWLVLEHSSMPTLQKIIIT